MTCISPMLRISEVKAIRRDELWLSPSDAYGFASDVYFYRIEVGAEGATAFVRTRNLTILR